MKSMGVLLLTSVEAGLSQHWVKRENPNLRSSTAFLLEIIHKVCVDVTRKQKVLQSCYF